MQEFLQHYKESLSSVRFTAYYERYWTNKYKELVPCLIKFSIWICQAYSLLLKCWNQVTCHSHGTRENPEFVRNTIESQTEQQKSRIKKNRCCRRIAHFSLPPFRISAWISSCFSPSISFFSLAFSTRSFFSSRRDACKTRIDTFKIHHFGLRGLFLKESETPWAKQHKSENFQGVYNRNYLGIISFIVEIASFTILI